MDSNRGEARHISQLLILGSYTAMVMGLIAEVILMGWELWALPLIAAAVAACWAIHIREVFSSRQRLWVYTCLMMATFFFYGTHVTSTYDMALLMITVMIAYTVTGESALVTFCQATYYLTLAYDLVVMWRTGAEWDSLLISRTALHIGLVFMAGWLARFIIRQWAQMFRDSDDQIVALDQAARRMNAFIANLSHELRTPVNAILGVSELLPERTRDPALQQDMATIRAAGRRMAAQISDIMDYSEIETDRMVVNEAPFAPASLFHDLVTALEPDMPENLELVVDVDADIPAQLVSDAGKLRKILYHIIGNSLKYTREGGVYVHVSAIRQSYGVNLCVEARDTGIGMSEAEIEQVAHRFFQADSRRSVRAGGLGIGLPIAQGLAAALGGFMMIDSAPGEGTTVRVSIPMKVADEQKCMSVADPDRAHLGGYLNIDKFRHPYVREFYNAMILNIVRGLGMPMHRVGSTADLRKLTARVKLTHLFVGLDEYLAAAELLEAMAREMTVIVVSRSDAMLPAGTGVHWMPKPLYAFPIVEILNAGARPKGDKAGRTTWPGTRALVVDDEPMNLSVASGILRRYGMVVTTAASGPEAIELCDRSRFDLVFMDHMMPAMDGMEAMKRLRRLFEARRERVPIVALTANALSGAREMFMREGFDGFVSKPIELTELERVLKALLPEASATTQTKAPEAQRPAPTADDPETDALRRLSASGLNVAKGLRYCGEDPAFYLSMLRQFEGDYPKKRARLEECHGSRDLRNYVILVHALKGNAGTIGAEALSDRARHMEEAARAAQMAYVEAHHGSLMEAYAAVVTAIQACCGHGAVPAAAEDEVLDFAPADDAPLEFAPEGGHEA